jgi:hypothetical protein
MNPNLRQNDNESDSGKEENDATTCIELKDNGTRWKKRMTMSTPMITGTS